MISFHILLVLSAIFAVTAALSISREQKIKSIISEDLGKDGERLVFSTVEDIASLWVKYMRNDGVYKENGELIFGKKATFERLVQLLKEMEVTGWTIKRKMSVISNNVAMNTATIIPISSSETYNGQPMSVCEKYVFDDNLMIKQRECHYVPEYVEDCEEELRELGQEKMKSITRSFPGGQDGDDFTFKNPEETAQRSQQAMIPNYQSEDGKMRYPKFLTDLHNVIGEESTIVAKREVTETLGMIGWTLIGSKIVYTGENSAVLYGKFQLKSINPELHGKVFPHCNILEFDLEMGKYSTFSFFSQDPIALKYCLGMAGAEDLTPEERVVGGISVTTGLGNKYVQTPSPSELGSLITSMWSKQTKGVFNGMEFRGSEQGTKLAIESFSYMQVRGWDSHLTTKLLDKSTIVEFGWGILHSDYNEFSERNIRVCKYVKFDGSGRITEFIYDNTPEFVSKCFKDALGEEEKQMRSIIKSLKGVDPGDKMEFETGDQLISHWKSFFTEESISIADNLKLMGIDTMTRALEKYYITPFQLKGWYIRDDTNFVAIDHEMAVHYGNMEWITDHKSFHGKVLPVCCIYKFDLKSKKLLVHGFFNDDLRVKGCMSFAGVQEKAFTPLEKVILTMKRGVGKDVYYEFPNARVLVQNMVNWFPLDIKGTVAGVRKEGRAALEKASYEIHAYLQSRGYEMKTEVANFKEKGLLIQYGHFKVVSDSPQMHGQQFPVCVKVYYNKNTGKLKEIDYMGESEVQPCIKEAQKGEGVITAKQ